MIKLEISLPFVFSDILNYLEEIVTAPIGLLKPKLSECQFNGFIFGHPNVVVAVHVVAVCGVRAVGKVNRTPGGREGAAAFFFFSYKKHRF